jgi:hypothetical protein
MKSSALNINDFAPTAQISTQTIFETKKVFKGIIYKT